MARVLIVEDNADVREELVTILCLENFDVLEAENGEIGHQLAQQHIPDLVLSDIMMPKLDGYGLFERLSSNSTTASIPFIFLTAKADRSSIRHGMNLGADDYITKPFEREDLLKAVRTRLEKRHKTQTEQFQIFSRRLVEVQELERQRVAGFLQNEIEQRLTGLKMTLSLAKRASTHISQTILEETQQLMDTMLDQVHTMALSLWPVMLEHLGLLPTLLWQINQFTEKTQIQVQLNHSGLEFPFDNELKTAIFRIVQEALENVEFHAYVNTVALDVHATEELLNLKIKDAGIGFDLESVASRAYGLLNMQERIAALSGAIEITSQSGQGTTISAQIPMQKYHGKNTNKVAANVVYQKVAQNSIPRPVMADSSFAPVEEAEHDSSPLILAEEVEKTPISIVLIDDNELIRAGLHQILDGEIDITVVGEYDRPADLLNTLATLKPQVALLDMDLQGFHVPSLIQEIVNTVPDVAILALLSNADDIYVWESLQRGATGCILKRNSIAELTPAIRHLASGQKYISSALSSVAPRVYENIENSGGRSILSRQDYESLTNREREILHLIARGRSNNEIAQELTLSVRTVETHRSNIMRKLDLHTKLDLLRYAIKWENFSI